MSEKYKDLLIKKVEELLEDSEPTSPENYKEFKVNGGQLWMLGTVLEAIKGDESAKRFLNIEDYNAKIKVKCDYCCEKVKTTRSTPIVTDMGHGFKMCEVCWEHERETIKGTYGRDIGEFETEEEK